jgi:hypothetical protein
VAIWNALPGGTPIAKFEDRKTAVRRLWAAFETLKPATRASKTNRSKDGRKPSKQADLISLLRRPEGATLEELVATTGWQPHSVRGALSGTIRKKLGLDLSSEKSDRGRVYRIVAKAA